MIDEPLLKAITKDINHDIKSLDYERLTGYLEVLISEPEYIQKIIKAYLENIEQ